MLPPVGQRSRYQCGGEYEMTLSRPTADQIEFSADGLTLASAIVYDDLDPNLNQPLIVQDPIDGIRYDFDLSTRLAIFMSMRSPVTAAMSVYTFTKTARRFLRLPAS